MSLDQGDRGSTSGHAVTKPSAGSTSELTTMGFLWRVTVATLVAWLASQVFNQLLMGGRLIPLPPFESVGQGEYLMLLFLSSLLATLAVAYFANLSALRGVALVQAVAIAHFGLNHLLTLVEATVFLPTMTAREVGLSIFSGAAESLILAICVGAALGRLHTDPGYSVVTTTAAPMSWWEWTWKFALCAVAYVFLYIVAGLMILPFVREYYPELVDKPFDPVMLLGLQVRRGIVYAACLVPLIRTARASRTRVALTVAVYTPIVHGVAGLMVPNEHMGPLAWRMAHTVEIGWSNFAFGLLIGFLFSRGISAFPRQTG